MRCLKFVLVSVYVILIILVLLLNLRSDNYRVDLNLIKEDSVYIDPVESAEKIGEKGKLKITLLWNFSADLDLHVQEPNGFEIYYKSKKDPQTGGYLDVDNMIGGMGAAENIFWENPPQGEYVVSVVYYKAVNDMVRTGMCQVVIFREKESPITYNIEMKNVKQEEIVARFNI